jgi:arabinose operon protein AraL
MSQSDLHSRYRYLVFDIHGVLLGRTEPAGHLSAVAVMSRLRAAGYGIRFLTNTSSVSRTNMAAVLEDVGIAADPSEVFTAATTVAHYLRHVESPQRLFVIGSDELRQEITRVSGTAIFWSGPDEADVAVVSRDPSLGQAILEPLCRNEGVRLIATCRDSRFPNGDGLDIGPGPTVELVERTLGKTAKVLGKPNHYVLTAVMGLTPKELAATLVIGDSPDQDIALANRAGASSVLLSTPGSAVSRETDNSAPRPDRVIATLDELLEFL